jgi:hypothetical protein
MPDFRVVGKPSLPARALSPRTDALNIKAWMMRFAAPDWRSLSDARPSD